MVTRREISALARQIAQEFDPQRIVPFGSYAYGTPNADSDVDLLIIKRFRGDHVRKAIEIRMAISPSFPVDLLVRTPAEVQARLDMDDYFMQDVINKGKILYEAEHRGVGRKSRGRLQRRPARVAQS